MSVAVADMPAGADFQLRNGSAMDAIFSTKKIEHVKKNILAEVSETTRGVF